MYNLFKTYRSDGDIPGIFNEMKYSHADANVKNNGIQNIEAMVKMLPSSVLILKYHSEWLNPYFLKVEIAEKVSCFG